MIQEEFVPEVPVPHDKPLGPIGLIKALRRNALEIWTKADFEKPVQFRKTFIDHRMLLNDPAGVRHVFLDNYQNYPKNELQLRLLRPALGIGLLTASGQDWKRQRRLLTPVFSTKKMQSYSAAQQQVAENLVDRLREKNGSIVDMHAEMGRVTLEVLEHTLFTSGIGCSASDFQLAVTDYMKTFGRVDIADLLGLPGIFPRIGQIRGRKVKSFLNKTVSDFINERRRLTSQNQSTPDDILSFLLKAKDEETEIPITEIEMKDNIISFIAAGHETATNVLSWTLYVLSKVTQCQDEIVNEIKTQYDPENPLTSLPKTKAFVEEVMRVYPPVPMMSRVALEDDVICGHKINAGMIVTVSPYVLHRHKTLWERPEVFDPRRFLPENRHNIEKFSYMPFGGGPHLCIGMAFAMMEMLVLLANILPVFRFEMDGDGLVLPEVRLSMRPADGLRMLVSVRN